jgi:hypothetical protein
MILNRRIRELESLLCDAPGNTKLEDELAATIEARDIVFKEDYLEELRVERLEEQWGAKHGSHDEDYL